MDRKARNREKVHASYQALEADIRVDNPGAKLVYPNQDEAAWEIIENFHDGVMAVTLLALPQVGKTGVMLAVAYAMTTSNNDSLFINSQNVYIISGMNDLDWQTQTKKSLPAALNEKVFTRSDFNKLTNLDSLENALIIIDECHIAAEARQQMSKKLRGAGLDNPEVLRDKNVRILQVSATPAHVLFNSERVWEEDHAIVRLQASPKYIGFEKLLAADRIMDTHESGVDNILEIEGLIKQEYPKPKYHVFRLGRKEHAVFNEMVKRNPTWIAKDHNCHDREDTDLLFDTPPVQHTFLLIKGFWRAGKRLNDKHIGIMYEGPANTPDVNVVAQSLAGRACGNDKQIPGKETPIIYCHKKSLQDYITWFNGNGSFNTYYQSRHLKTDGDGNIFVKPSYQGEGFRQRLYDYEISEGTFDTVEQAKVWVSENLTYGCSEDHLRDSNGKLGGTTHFQYRGKARAIRPEAETRGSSDLGYGVASAARLMPVDNGQGANTSARIMPVTTPTLKYIVIYKKDFLIAKTEIPMLNG